MELFDSIEITLVNIIDIILAAALLYYIYTLVRGTVAINIFIGFIVVYLIWELTKFLKMNILSAIIGGFMSVGFFALIVLFQQEIRKFLLSIGSANFPNRKKFIKRLRFMKQQSPEPRIDIETILSACHKMGTTRTGAILVLEQSNPLESIKSTGDKMKIEVTQPIIESIFFKNSPLHDGAAIIRDNHIIATRVILPVSERKDIPFRYGLRHRAAIGVTEKTDALALVVSEETGQLSYIRNGDFVFFKDLEDLKDKIKEDIS